MEPIRDTFEERKRFIYEYLNKKLKLSTETNILLSYIYAIPFQQNAPLTDEYMLELKSCTSDEDVRRVLKKVFEKQTDYEFRHIRDIKRKLNVHSMDIYQQLNLLIHEFKRIESHGYQKDITDLISQLNKQKQDLIEGFDVAINYLENWANKKES
ncbi:hypothetical protein [Metabacillus malikii]|uniref:Uncharacterized protein n=1 Tax=Metabacillus malikii TaxID=1504265 RepID=A0ABT9ZFR7_9BACI|nr:hypothetical protein [Metabacillus malikii]MDQ0230105.1 hypothetical protein [Metabacillus malikii]